jgi:hypothetical protein
MFGSWVVGVYRAGILYAAPPAVPAIGGTPGGWPALILLSDALVLRPVLTPLTTAPAPCKMNGNMLGDFWYMGSMGSSTGCLMYAC